MADKTRTDTERRQNSIDTIQKKWSLSVAEDAILPSLHSVDTEFSFDQWTITMLQTLAGFAIWYPGQDGLETVQEALGKSQETTLAGEGHEIERTVLVTDLEMTGTALKRKGHGKKTDKNDTEGTGPQGKCQRFPSLVFTR